ncbi:hypothetical protein HCN44_000266 [Aphidius gifuensis]|uniref:G domain-containing protein n=1 Tax=Aphidius gifuensis TaxID=684658 RepID=A0A834XPE1_APHGI|nr:hypothetical protein HCN44_000266 [Aphidius gifuensis]
MNLIKAEDCIAGQNKDCFGKNENDAVIKVLVSTIVRDIDGNVLADLDEEQISNTLLRSITRERLKIACYPFTTLKPYLKMVLYDDNEQIAVADLPGLIEDSHKNRGLEITFFKPAERYAYLF